MEQRNKGGGVNHMKKAIAFLLVAGLALGGVGFAGHNPDYEPPTNAQELCEAVKTVSGQDFSCDY